MDNRVFIKNTVLSMRETTENQRVLLKLMVPEIYQIRICSSCFAVSVKLRSRSQSFLELNGSRNERELFSFHICLVHAILPYSWKFIVTKEALILNIPKLNNDSWKPGEWMLSSSEIEKCCERCKIQSTAYFQSPFGEHEIEQNQLTLNANNSDGRVSRLGSSTADASLRYSSVTGYVGLENYANNCYLNSIVQVLVNITELRDYLLRGDYISHINMNNPLGSRGDVVHMFAKLNHFIWQSCYKKLKPDRLKLIMCQKNDDFSADRQCDAQEFFLSLIDFIHEDLNANGRLPYTQEREKEDEENGSDIENDESKEALITWQRHIQRNKSIIVDLFHGLVHTNLICSDCKHKTNSYDAFPLLSIPVALCQSNLHFAVYFNLPSNSKTHLYHFSVGTAVMKEKQLDEIVSVCLKRLAAHFPEDTCAEDFLVLPTCPIEKSEKDFFSPTENQTVENIIDEYSGICVLVRLPCKSSNSLSLRNMSKLDVNPRIRTISKSEKSRIVPLYHYLIKPQPQTRSEKLSANAVVAASGPQNLDNKNSKELQNSYNYARPITEDSSSKVSNSQTYSNPFHQFFGIFRSIKSQKKPRTSYSSSKIICAVCGLRTDTPYTNSTDSAASAGSVTSPVCSYNCAILLKRFAHQNLSCVNESSNVTSMINSRDKIQRNETEMNEKEHECLRENPSSSPHLHSSKSILGWLKNHMNSDQIGTAVHEVLLPSVIYLPENVDDVNVKYLSPLKWLKTQVIDQMNFFTTTKALKSQNPLEKVNSSFCIFYSNDALEANEPERDTPASRNSRTSTVTSTNELQIEIPQGNGSNNSPRDTDRSDQDSMVENLSRRRFLILDGRTTWKDIQDAKIFRVCWSSQLKFLKRLSQQNGNCWFSPVEPPKHSDFGIRITKRQHFRSFSDSAAFALKESTLANSKGDSKFSDGKYSDYSLGSASTLECDNKSDGNSTKSGQAAAAAKIVTIADCLNVHFRKETTDDKRHCDHCKSLCRVHISNQLVILPPILVIHLKRFEYSYNTRKIDRPVNVPTKLDMRNYVCNSLYNQKTQYQLFGMVCHYGNGHSGHYISLARTFSQNNVIEFGWRMFDDAVVQNLTKDEFEKLKVSAYILFYRRMSDEPLLPRVIHQLIEKPSPGSANANDCKKKTEADTSQECESDAKKTSPLPVVCLEDGEDTQNLILFKIKSNKTSSEDP